MCSSFLNYGLNSSLVKILHFFPPKSYYSSVRYIITKVCGSEFKMRKNNEEKWKQLKIPAPIYEDLHELRKVLKENFPTKNWKWEDILRFLIYLARVAMKLEKSPRFSQETAEPFKFSRINQTILDAKRFSSEFPTVYEGIIIGLLEKCTKLDRKTDVKTIIEYASLIVDLIDKSHSRSKELDKEVKRLLSELIKKGLIYEAITFSEKYFKKIVPEIMVSAALNVIDKNFVRARNIFLEALKRQDSLEKNLINEELIFEFYRRAMKRFKRGEKGRAEHPKDILKDLFSGIRGLENKLHFLEISSKYWREYLNYVPYDIFGTLYDELWEEYSEIYSRIEIIKSLIRSSLVDKAIEKWNSIKEKGFDLSSKRDELATILINNGYSEYVQKILLEDDELLSPYYYFRVAEYNLCKEDIDSAWDSLNNALKSMILLVSNGVPIVPNSLFLKKWYAKNLDELLSRIKSKSLADIILETDTTIELATWSYSSSGDAYGMKISVIRGNNTMTDYYLSIYKTISNINTLNATKEEKRLFGEILYRFLQLPNIKLDLSTPIIVYLPYAGYSDKATELYKSHFSSKKTLSFNDIDILKILSYALIETNNRAHLIEILDYVIEKLKIDDKQVVRNSEGGLKISADFIAYIKALVKKETLVHGPDEALSLLSNKNIKRLFNKLQQNQKLYESFEYFRDELIAEIIRTLIETGETDKAIDLIEKQRISDFELGNLLIKKLLEEGQIEMASVLINELGLDVSDEALESVLIYRLRKMDFERFNFMWKSLSGRKKENLRENIGREIGRYLVNKYFSEES